METNWFDYMSRLPRAISPMPSAPPPPSHEPRQFALALENGPLRGLSPAERTKARLRLAQLLLQAAEVAPRSLCDDDA